MANNIDEFHDSVIDAIKRYKKDPLKNPAKNGEVHSHLWSDFFMRALSTAKEELKRGEMPFKAPLIGSQLHCAGVYKNYIEKCKVLVSF